MSQINGSTKYTYKKIITTETRFRRNPVLIISIIFRYPEPKTTALGGVATGNIKAHDAANAAPNKNPNGWTSMVKAIGARMGRIIDVVAVLEVISVRKLINKRTTSKRMTKETPLKTVTCPAIQLARPLLAQAAAMAKPPPNNRMIPHGTFLAASQSIIR